MKETPYFLDYVFYLFNLFQDRDYEDRILVEGEDIEMIKKHEQEKIAAMKEDELQIDDEMETVWILLNK